MQLSLDLIEQWVMEHPEASICTAQGASEFRRIANYQDYHGLKEFREVTNGLAMANNKQNARIID